MTVNNVNALSPFGTVQGGQTSVKPEEAAQEGFDRLIAKMGGQLAGMQKSGTGSARPAAPATPKQALVEGAQQAVQMKNASGQDNTVQAAGTKGPENTDASADDANGAVKQEQGSQAAAGTENAKEQNAAQEAVEEAAEDLKQEVADVMDVSLEKVEEAMEILGLTAVDLFDPANLRQLLLNLTENTDELALVTDEGLYGNLQELLQTVQDTLGALQEELGLDGEELRALMEQVNGAEADAVPGTDEPEVSVEGMKDYAVSVQKDGGTVQIKVTVDDASGEKHVSEQMTDTGKPETQPVLKKSEAGDAGHRQEGGAGEQTAGNAFLQNLTGHTGDVEMPAEQPVYAQPETNQIMDQIMEYMKVNIKPETQEVEMQLHPASLGTVHVQLAAKDGVITAQFAAQNEAVKAVLETQMIQLKEQFEEQGIKVSAVEVTVANHAFNEQFDNGQEAADQEREAAKKGTRRINLNLDDLEEEGLEELEDSERIAVEMMQANGNTVDYTA